MPSSVSIRKIPTEHVGLMWPLVQPWLEKGLKAATDTGLAGVLMGLKEGTDQLWIAFDKEAVVGAFLTAIHQDDDDPNDTFLAAYALGGERLPEWAAALGETMADFAKYHKCKAVRFCGRPGWQRLLPAYSVTGAYRGHSVFERAVS